jgi:hypothetical protein
MRFFAEDRSKSSRLRGRARDGEDDAATAAFDPGSRRVRDRKTSTAPQRIEAAT